MKYAHNMKEMPMIKHYAIITFGSKWTPPYDAHDTGYIKILIRLSKTLKNNIS